MNRCRAFETVYRAVRDAYVSDDRDGPELFIEFSKAVHAEFGLRYSDRDRGHDHFVWSQNELRSFGQGRETVKELCFGAYWRVAGPRGVTE